MISKLLLLLLALIIPANSALDRSQVNTRRRQDMARIMSAMTDYQSNNNGNLPKTRQQLDIWVKRYVTASDQLSNDTACSGEQFCDPDGKPYVINEPTVLSEDVSNALGDDYDFETDGHEIHYFINAYCGDAEGSLKYSDDGHDYAVMYVLEGGAIYCGDNQ